MRKQKLQVNVVLLLLMGFSTIFRLQAATADTVIYQSPLKIPISLSGNYAELRGGRFHAGIDFRAYGKVGDPIYAAAEGYIARVTVGSSGYGNGIYVTHSDGTQTVYGHLSRFTDAVVARVREEQYKKERFSVDLSFGIDEFPVAAGTLIGYVGNSGSSGAPHLHFEVRRPDQSGPLNPLRAGVVTVKDSKAPEINHIRFVGYFEDSSGVAYTQEVASFRYGASGVIQLPEYSYLSIDAVDRQDGTPAKLGIEHYQVWVDDSLIYNYKVGEYLYHENKSYHALIDYAAKQRGQGNCVKTWIEPGNEFVFRRASMGENGLIHLEDDSEHQLRLLLTDEHGNATERKFRIKRNLNKYEVCQRDLTERGDRGAWTAWFLPRWESRPGLQLGFLPGTFYRNVRVQVEEVKATGVEYSSVWKIGDPEIALKRSAHLMIQVQAPDSLASKLVLGRLSDKGKWVACGGKLIGDTLVASIGSFGTYAVLADTQAPMIKARFKQGADLRRKSQCAWTIKDELTGIWDWTVKIDGKWVIAQFDAKNHKLWVELDPEVVERGKRHVVEVFVWDGRQNLAHQQYDIIW